ncbi:hypothetical protein WT60_22940 [Burkholderia sp. MSMB617WGS]|uniref:Metal-binding membrane protein n=2 Tax=Burkholderiaceae TaxID=119060 RepID=A0ABR5T804_9BURK|nr:hypothetical protein WS78_21140 [Burkholderia savannae]AOK51100.1 hypothetical protein WT60_22940 [Burkholderia sp. MSMB617WGS]KGR95385.1 hypothetical protein X946_5108 [Burkholderia sp. ABCPW 111]KVG49205.1 hypothetical protein WS77_26230 [Burkholderia sp. MSMB0265]KVG81935.1 hypothetical protein WS81_11115 [Burkholderia sp. MSMB2040]KVG92450.1 hypothetical protein WS82_11580 [Burkholderia sp. MSMB2041]KVG97390.1 hypothetical protein WS83_31320 [Burkholderia sp. MSMB2042]KVK78562.1 hypot
MKLAERRLDAPLVALASISVIAWSALIVGAGGLMPPALCAIAGDWRVPLSTWLRLAYLSNSPAKFAADSVLMVAAMMAPLAASPLRHVLERSFARRRTRAALLFVAGYAAVWLAAWIGLQIAAIALTWAAPGAVARMSAGLALALLWQASPAKQWFLNVCHRRPPLAAFGMAAERDALRFGLASGASCAGNCWALMLLPLLAGPAHVPATIAVMGFIVAERIERPATPAWRCRGPGKAVRIVSARVRATLASLRLPV